MSCDLGTTSVAIRGRPGRRNQRPIPAPVSSVGDEVVASLVVRYLVAGRVLHLGAIARLRKRL
jgi:hypothetical protein